MGAIRLSTASESGSAQQLAEAALRIATQGNHLRAAEMFQQALARDPDNLLALLNLGAILCQTGQLSDAIDHLRRAFEIAPGNNHARSNYSGACGMDADAKIAAGDHAGAVPRLRELLALDHTNTAARINLIDCLFRSVQPATLTDFAPGLENTTLGKKLFIACMPKSGSSWLLNGLTTLTGFPRSAYVFAFLQNEQELYLPDMIAGARADAVIQQHCRATAANLQLMQAFAIRPVVLVRNLFDTVISLTDFYATGASVNTFVHRDFATLQRAQQLDLVIDHFAPWYLQFVASWAIAEEEQRLDFAWLTYEDMMADKTAAIANLNDYFNLGKSAGEIEATLARIEDDRVKNRFNKGVAGRGDSELNADQKGRLVRLASYFPSISFEKIGL